MKRIHIFITVLILVLIMSVSASALKGDMNGDDSITAVDARLILRLSAGLDTLTPEKKIIADINGDGKVNAVDARKALRISAMLEDAPANETGRIEVSASSEKLNPSQVYEKASLYTAEIITYNENGMGLTVGTCFFISQNRVVTAYHVINGAHFAKVRIGGKTADVEKVLGYNTKTDIAILSVDYKSPYVALSGTAPETTDTVYTLGSPKGYTGSFSQGMVSCKNRVLKELGNGVEYIQFTAPVSEGNSGGPVINESGDVVGIVALCNESGQNLNFALPVSEIGKTDISSPLTLGEVAKKTAESEFSGQIALSSPALTIRKGATALMYVLVGATDEYSIACESDNADIKAQTGRSYGNVNVVYVSASAENLSGTVKIYIEGHEDVFAVVDVTVSDDAPDSYAGINGNIYDFGVYAGICPALCDENTHEGKNAYSFAYSVKDIVAEGKDATALVDGYKNILADKGYTTVSSGNTVAMYNEENKTTVTFGVTADANGDSFVYVLIIR